MAKYSGPGVRPKRGGRAGGGRKPTDGAGKQGGDKKPFVRGDKTSSGASGAGGRDGRPRKPFQRGGKRERSEGPYSGKRDEPLAKKGRKEDNPDDMMVAEAKKLLCGTNAETDEKERTKVIDQVFSLTKGRLRSIALKHDSSRIIQALLKYGSPPQRTVVFDEIEPHIMDLVKEKYGHFIVKKLIQYCDKERAINALRGHIPELLRQQYGAGIVELAFSDYASPLDKCRFVEEFYGAEYQKFPTDKRRTLKELIESNPAAKGVVMLKLKNVISSLANKPHVSDTTLFAAVCAQYFSVCEASDVAELVPLFHDLVLHMVHTRDGMKVGMRCVECGTAKDRKAFIKNLKGHVTDAFKDAYAHHFIVALLDRTDDTTLLKSAIIDVCFLYSHFFCC